jgi:spoIIIJ-associated protein
VTNILSAKQDEAASLSSLLQTLITDAGLELSFFVVPNEPAIAQADDASGASSTPATPSDTPSGEAVPTPVRIEFTGPDTPMLTARNGELLHALEHIATQALRLEPEQHDRISFDADSYKVNRDRAMRSLADKAIESVRMTERPFAFPPMNSRERRLLHLALVSSGLPTASSGDMPRRFVVLYPEGFDVNTPVAATPSRPVKDREHAIRNSFRRR